MTFMVLTFSWKFGRWKRWKLGGTVCQKVVDSEFIYLFIYLFNIPTQHSFTLIMEGIYESEGIKKSHLWRMLKEGVR